MAGARPNADGLGRWLVAGLVAGAILLSAIVIAFALGRSSASPAAAPATAAAGSTGPASPAPARTPPPSAPAPAGDAAAGKVVFEQTCGGCHMEAGTAGGGAGPKLQGLGLTQALITRQIQNGGAVMPGGLVTGTDLQNVVAYVRSLQR